MLIADRLPRLAGILAPALERLERDLAQSLPERYRERLPFAGAALDASADPAVQRLWDIIRRHGQALPQERYVVDTNASADPSSRWPEL